MSAISLANQQSDKLGTDRLKSSINWAMTTLENPVGPMPFLLSFVAVWRNHCLEFWIPRDLQNCSREIVEELNTKL